MNTIEALREFKLLIEKKLAQKTTWGRNEFTVEISIAYQEILEHLVEGKKPST